MKPEVAAVAADPHLGKNHGTPVGEENHQRDDCEQWAQRYERDQGENDIAAPLSESRV
jgi:hypothetical protein